MSSLEKCLFISSAYFLTGFFDIELHELFAYFGVSPLTVIDFCEVTLYSEDLLMYLFFFFFFPRLLKLLCRQLHYV